jgi:phosphoserine phosphatase RsbU/P
MAPPAKTGLGARLQQFWRRVTEGLELHQLWAQFQSDARASYHLYSRDIELARPQGVHRGQHFWNVVRQFFWAILNQLSPARRVLLLLALVLMLFAGEVAWHDRSGGFSVFYFDLRFLGGLLLLLLLVLEVGDRVVMKRDLQIAREIQMWLVPGSPPQVPGVEVAFATRPANTVAGDFYDVFPRAKRESGQATFLVVVADVAGKSIPAALLMASFQASLKTLSNTPAPLHALVDAMNRYACTNSQEGRRFITAFVGEFCPESRAMTYINAGHNAPLWRHVSGAIERLQTGGLPLGVKPDTNYESATIMLQPGDWLAIFTDGLVEAANERGEEYGEQRIIALLNAAGAGTPAQIISRLMVDLDIFVGNNLPLGDDVTCLLLRITA